VLAIILFKRHMGRNMHKELEALGGVEMPKFDFWSWVEKTFTPDYRKEVDAYLADSTDHYDLEFRMRTLMRRGVL